MTDKYLITLVHGTFAPEAPWTRVDTNFGFRKKLEERLGDVEFRSVSWSGRNRHVDRREGAQLLRESIAELDLMATDRRHFLVCHSHGGNIALYASEGDDFSGRIHGVVCMNTPFLCALPRNFTPMFMAVVLTLILLVGLLVEFLAGMWYVDWDWWVKVLVSLVVALPVFLLNIGLLYSMLSMEDLLESFATKRDELARQLGLPRTTTPVLSVWTAGDEVSFAFGIASGIADVPFILLYPPLAITVVIGLLVGVIAGWLPALDLLQIESSGWLSGLARWSDTYILDPLLTAGVYFVGTVVCVVVLVILVNVPLLILPYGLGMRNILAPLWIRLFATPVPILARNTDFISIDPAALGLSHSSVYELDQAVDAIAEWMQTREPPGGAGG